MQILGAAGHVHGLRCQRMTLSEPDEQAADAGRSPSPVRTLSLAGEHVLVAIGEAPDPSFLPDGTSVDVGAWGGLLINPQTLATGAPGRLRRWRCHLRTEVHYPAAAHGRHAARSIHAFLRKLSPAAVSEMPDGDFRRRRFCRQDGRSPWTCAPSRGRSCRSRESAAAHATARSSSSAAYRRAGPPRGQPLPALRSGLSLSDRPGRGTSEPAHAGH